MRRTATALLLTAVAWAGEALPDGWYHLELASVLPGKTAKDLQLDLVRAGGAWQEQAWGYAPTFNVTDHPATVAAREDGSLHVELRLQSDPWVAGGPGTLELHLATAGPIVTGTWSGTALARAGEGAVHGSLGPPRISVVAQPLPRFEHPRLLFRAADLPRLKAAAATPAGQAIIARLRGWLAEGEAKGYDYPNLAYAVGMGAAGNGLLYQLTGDPAYAAKAFELAVTASTSTTAQHETGGYAAYILGNALAYDLCWQAWGEDQRLEIGRWLHGYVDAIARLHVFLTQAKVPVIKGGPNPGNSGFAIFRAAAGMAALAIQGDVGEYPDRPKAVQVAEIAPVPGDGGEPLESDVLPRRWLWCGTFPLDGASPIVAAGGADKLQPAAGSAPVAGGPAFADLATSLLIGGEAPTGIDLLAAHGKALRTRSLLAVALVNDRTRTMQVRLGYTAVDAWLGGRPVKDRDIIRLAPGRYPLLLDARVILEPPSGTLTLAPRLIDVPDPQLVQRDWQEGYDAYQASGRAWPRVDSALRICERQIHKQLDVLWGETGWDVGDINGGGHIAGMSWSRLFATALRRCQGRDLATGTAMAGMVQRLLVRGESADDVATVCLDAGEAPFVRAIIERQAASMPLGRIPAALATLAEVQDMPVGDPTKLPLVVADVRRTSVAWRNGWTPDAAIVQFTGNTGPSGSSRSAGDVLVGGFAAPKGFWSWSGRYELGDINYTPVRPTVNVVQIAGAIVAGPPRSIDSLDTPTGGARSISLDSWYPGSGADVRFSDKATSKTDLGIHALRATAVDFSGAAGAPALIAIADRITGHGVRALTWTWQTPLSAVIRADGFTVPGPDGRTLDATVVRPAGAVITQRRGQPLSITGGSGEFLIVMTLQQGAAPPVSATATGATVGGTSVAWDGERLRIGR